MSTLLMLVGYICVGIIFAGLVGWSGYVKNNAVYCVLIVAWPIITLILVVAFVVIMLRNLGWLIIGLIDKKSNGYNNE